MTDPLLSRVRADEIPSRRRTPIVDAATFAAAAEIVEDVRERGDAAVREHAERLGDLEPGAPMVLGRERLESALADLAPDERELLERTTARIRSFADAQRAALADVEIEVPGGSAGHSVAPVERAGCYAPGGRFPLPSSVSMTAVTASAAGVEGVVVASPRPTEVVLAAAAAAGADALLAVGGPQAIAALAFGVEGVEPVDVIAGPGNRWVVAAKKHLVGEVGIDLLAGPSELLVLADDSADPALVAADLIAQAEHDADARPMIATTDPGLVDAVERELVVQLASLATRDTCLASLATNGLAVLCRDTAELVTVSDRLAPEHLEVMTRDARGVAGRARHYGAVFVGAESAEVFGDYGAGPNHTLPTAGGARWTGGLSVFHFLRIRTWLRTGDPDALAKDAAALARLEGLEGHARSAARRGS